MSNKHVSIAVAPFRNLSAGSDTEHIANGLVEDVSGNLARFRSLRVISTQSTFALAQSGKSLEDVADEWGVHYLLHGSVRSAETDIRVSVHLVRARGGETLWSERFDVPRGNILDVQDEISSTVAGKLAVHVDRAALESARSRAGGDLEAYECCLRGMECLRKGTLEGDEESRPEFERALGIDPRYARAFAGLSLSHFNEWTCHAWHLWDVNEKNAFHYAEQALGCDDRDPMIHSVLARVHRFRHQHGQADAHAESALTLNPNDPHVLIQIAVVKLFGGEASEGCELARRAIALNPLHGGWYHGIVGWNQFMLGDHEGALCNLEKGGHSITNFAAYRAACLVEMGEIERARQEYGSFVEAYRSRIAFGREANPDEALTWAIQVEPFRRLEDSSRMPDALRRAGIAKVDVSRALGARERTMVRPAGIATPAGNVFRREGESWSIAYEGQGARLVGLKGFEDIARLIAQPGESLHCLGLFGAPVSGVPADSALDARARQEYLERLVDLENETERAEADNDVARAERARSEYDEVVNALAKATGLGGRSRTIGDAAERARSAVTWRIRSAIKKIAAAHPRLGQHLSNSIRTGHFCTYSPETAIDWEL